MRKVLGFTMLAFLLGGCAARTPEETLSPAAFADRYTSRCEAQARTVAPPGQSVTNARGESDISRDMYQRTYWNCVREWPR
jgi:hypothetical protein